MSTLFPAWRTSFSQATRCPVDLAGETRWYHFGGYRRQFESGYVSLMMSRPLLEWHIRRRVLTLPNVMALQECTVDHLLASTIARG